MDVTPSTVVVSGSGEEGLSTTTIGAMLLFFLAIAGFGYYVIQKSKAPALTPKVPVNPAANKTLPTVPAGAKTSAGSAVSGLLTDPNLFKGLIGLSTTIAGMVKSNKSGGGVDASADPNSPTGYVDSEGSIVNKDGSDYTGTGTFSDKSSTSSADLQAAADMVS